MFRFAAFNFAGLPQVPVIQELFTAHPAEIAGFMEAAWDARNPALNSGVIPGRGMPASLRSTSGVLAGAVPTTRPHLIEAFTFENTNAVQIFQRVLSLFSQGEQLAAAPDQAAPNVTTDIMPWLRSTETLFYNDPPPFYAYSVSSAIRSDVHQIRQNAYIRMFGSNVLNPIQPEGNVRAMPPAASNREFWPTLERLLFETWRGIVNANNTSGRRETDDAAIARYSLSLNDMIGVRRRGGTLSREEFAAGCFLNWLHVAIAFDSPIVRALKAEADSPGDRLLKIGERVGVPAHSRSTAFIQLAPLLGWLLETIESGIFNMPASAPNLYSSPANQARVSQIITLYMNATGRDIKASSVTVSQRA
jgi:hypothetical protein